MQKTSDFGRLRDRIEVVFLTSRTITSAKVIMILGHILQVAKEEHVLTEDVWRNS